MRSEGNFILQLESEDFIELYRQCKDVMDQNLDVNRQIYNYINIILPPNVKEGVNRQGYSDFQQMRMVLMTNEDLNGLENQGWSG